MRLNLSTIKTEVKSKLHDSTLTDAQIERWVDMAQDRIIRSMDCDFLLDVKTFDSVADQRTYYIDAGFNRVLHVLDEDNNRILDEISEREILTADPDLSSSGTSDFYSLTGIAEVQAQFDGASKITVVSSSASDTTQTVRIRGKVSGVETTEAISLNGTTSVDSTNTYDADQDILARLSTACVGKITVTDTEDSGTLAIIPAGFYRHPMIKLSLYPTPSDDDVTYKALVYRNPFYLTDEQDIPDLPHGWEDLVLSGVMVEAYTYAYEFDIAEKAEIRFQRDISALTKEQGDSRNTNRRIRCKPKWGLSSRGRLPDTYDG